MNILLLGSGGREHALAWKLALSPRCSKLFIAPGNGGTSMYGTNLPISATDEAAVLQACRTHDISLVVVGPEEPLVRGIVSFFVVFFWAAFEQAGASLNLFADRNTDRELGSVTVPASLFQSLNSIFVILFAPLFAWLWLRLGRREPSAPTKMAIGLLLLTLGYIWISFGVQDVAPDVRVSMVWLVGMYMLHTWGELCLSPIGLSLVNKLAPLKFASLLMAVWFLANAAANKLAGVLSALIPSEGRTTSVLGYEINNLYDFFLLFVVMAGAASLILFGLTKRLQKMMHQ